MLRSLPRMLDGNPQMKKPPEGGLFGNSDVPAEA
jgi:hypothetical protein